MLILDILGSAARLQHRPPAHRQQLDLRSDRPARRLQLPRRHRPERVRRDRRVRPRQLPAVAQPRRRARSPACRRVFAPGQTWNDVLEAANITAVSSRLRPQQPASRGGRHRDRRRHARLRSPRPGRCSCWGCSPSAAWRGGARSRAVAERSMLARWQFNTLIAAATATRTLHGGGRARLAATTPS